MPALYRSCRASLPALNCRSCKIVDLNCLRYSKTAVVISSLRQSLKARVALLGLWILIPLWYFVDWPYELHGSGSLFVDESVDSVAVSICPSLVEQQS